MTDATDDELVELCTSVWIEAIGDGQEEANMATARACYNRGRADLLSELKAVIDEAGLRELEAKATQGEWHTCSPFADGCMKLESESSNLLMYDEGIGPRINKRSDAELIVALRNTLPKLLALVPAEAGDKEE